MFEQLQREMATAGYDRNNLGEVVLVGHGKIPFLTFSTWFFYIVNPNL